MKEKDYLVCIHCMTYNHASYIEDAMNGFCMQQTTFPFVAIVVDDASTDGEPEVIKTYLNTHFDMVNARQWESDDAVFIEAHHKENLACTFAVVLLKYNFWQAKKGKEALIKEWSNTRYVAICEGDDYWTAPSKLQKQIDFLERHQDYSLCAHAVNYIQDGIIIKTDRISECECDLSLQDLIVRGGDFLSTPSLVFRLECEKIIPHFRRVAKVGDYPLVLHMGIMGKVHYFPMIMGNYRYQSVGSWSQRNSGEKKYDYFLNEVEWLEEFNQETKFKFDAAVKYRIALFAKILLFRGIISEDTFRKYLKYANIFRLKREYRNEYFWLIVTYKYNKQYQSVCKIWRNILKFI